MVDRLSLCKNLDKVELDALKEGLELYEEGVAKNDSTKITKGTETLNTALFFADLRLRACGEVSWTEKEFEEMKKEGDNE